MQVTGVTPIERRVLNPSCGRGNSRQIIQKTLDGNVFRIWNSIRIAGDTLKISKNSILTCCSKKLNTAGGWCWMYYEDYVEQNSDGEWREIEINSQKFSLILRKGSDNQRMQAITELAGFINIRFIVLVVLAFCPNEKGKRFVNHIILPL
ncbi:hypothetical protein RclHR1_08520010 [Rhizophagus clarus]|nr:hypothetical protein RclHR1_08520010 [Rhizophagus clarus]